MTVYIYELHKIMIGDNSHLTSAFATDSDLLNYMRSEYSNWTINFAPSDGSDISVIKINARY